MTTTATLLRRTFITATAAAACLTFGMAHAQDKWPDKPVRLVVPYAPGGTTDYVARQVAQQVGEQLGSSFVVENRAGASGTIGTAQVAKAKPDGTTFLVNDTTYSMLPSIFKRLAWDHANDLVPVTLMATTPVVLVVPADSPHKSLAELLEFARSNPGKLNFGSGGAGSSTHLASAILGKRADVEFMHVPYKGASEAMVGVMSGQVDFLITAGPTALSTLKGGRIRALAVSGEQRVEALPDVPTFAEAGVEGYEVSNWFGLAAPKGTPEPIVQKLQEAVKKALEDEKLQAQFKEQGAIPGAMTTEEFTQWIAQQNAFWTKAAEEAGVKPE